MESAMIRRAIVASTTNFEAYNAVCSWANSRAIDERVTRIVFESVATVVVHPGSDGDDPTYGLLMTELHTEPGAWKVKEIEYQS
jgi:hypothetical protein